MSDALERIKNILPRGMATDAWVAENRLRGQKVAMYRRYVDGEHDADMTEEMKNALRVNSVEGGNPFASNQCDNVVQSMVDRINLIGIQGASGSETDADPQKTSSATSYAEELADFNDLEALAVDIAEGAVRDGDSFLLAEYDDEEDQVKWTYQPAWDGVDGMLVIHDDSRGENLLAAMKVWYTSAKQQADTLNVNVYMRDRILKYQGSNAGSLQLLNPDAIEIPNWTTLPNGQGEPIGVPVIQYRNKQRGTSGYGLSEIEDAIPLQNALNRVLYSAVMVCELLGFGIYVAEGFTPPQNLTPGMWLRIGRRDASGNVLPLKEGEKAKAYKIEGSSIAQFIEFMDKLETRIDEVTRTPRTKLYSNISADAMKESESKLVFKVERFNRRAAIAWEKAMKLTVTIQESFGRRKPPKVKRWRAIYSDARVKTPSDIVDNALKVKDQVGELEFLRLVKDAFGWDDNYINNIVAEKQKEAQQRAAAIVGGLPTFNEFNSAFNDSRSPVIGAGAVNPPARELAAANGAGV